jgi:hypothetical protein
MRISVFGSAGKSWCDAFNMKLAYKTEQAGDECPHHWDIIILTPGCIPKKTSAHTLIASGGDNTRLLSVTQRVSYGLSDNDMISVSSLSERDMMVSLNRGLLNLSGYEIEPREWRIKKHPNWSIDQTLAFEALLLLLP